MTKAEYKAEVEKLKNGSDSLPSKGFIEMFLKRLEKGWAIANKNGYHNDSEDYHAWGYALFFDVHQNGEDFIYNLTEEQHDALFDN